MDNYQTMLKLCMIGVPVFTILTAMCAFGWNYYGLKIKEVDTLKKGNIASKNTYQNSKIYNIGGDLVYGDKNTVINKNYAINKKLNEAFEKLNSPDYTERNIAIDYIVNNLPKTLPENRIKALITASTVLASNLSDPQTKLCYFLVTQKKSESIENYFKQVISYNASSAIAWRYLLREDVAIDLAYVFSVIKDRRNHCISYQNIVQYAMDIEDGRVCTALLNSHDLVDFLISNDDEKDYLKRAHDWINQMIERKPVYEKYKNTYFFKAVVFE